jgi:hypothetical protein
LTKTANQAFENQKRTFRKFFKKFDLVRLFLQI